MLDRALDATTFNEGLSHELVSPVDSTHVEREAPAARPTNHEIKHRRTAGATNNGAEVREETDRIYLRLLDDIAERLAHADGAKTVDRALEELFVALQQRVLNTPPDEWRDFVAACRRHPLMALLHQDPFTYRAFSKPRGYAGDAVMMDFIYGREDRLPPPPAEELGQRIFDYTTRAPASEGVRARRAFVATQIDRATEERRRPHIMAIASGHLREAGLSVAVRRSRVGRFLALDADALSLAEVDRAYGCYGVETVTASFARLLGRQRHEQEFDLVYSTGLFDYLNQRTGRRLVSSMFGMLRSGGSLIVANFLPGVRDIGYMETFMDWNLIYRSRHDMLDLTAEIAEADIRSVSLVSEECKNIVFLQLQRV